MIAWPAVARKGSRAGSRQPRGFSSSTPSVVLQAPRPGSDLVTPITSFEGQLIREVSDLLVALRRAQPGQREVTLIVLRDGQRQQMSVTLSDRPRR